MSNNVIAVLILVGAFLFIVPLFIADHTKPFLKEYFSCMFGLTLLAVFVLVVSAVASLVWWALVTLLQSNA